MDPRTTKLAYILVNYSTEVKPGDRVAIRGDIAAAPLLNEVLRYTLRAGGLPQMIIDSDEFMETLYTEAGPDQLEYAPPIEKIQNEESDVIIFVRASENTRALTGVDPEKQAMHQSALRPYREARMDRSAAGTLRWVLTQYPCAAYAQEGDMSLEEFENFVYGATFADQEDPVACWLDIAKTQQRLVDWLKGKSQVEVRGPNVDLALSIKGRTFINSAGKRNMPSGEIYTGPVENSVNGWVKFTYPAVREGREVEGVEFRFEDGKVVEASAKKNAEYLYSQLDSDKGARYLGEFAVGTNYGIQRFTKNILFDEKIAGTIHMAVGAGYPDTGSKNRSAVHWDFICDMRDDSEIVVDGELFYKNGAFTI
ncbi:MAG TPA: aminopeptidase [Anaerolineales bacterium]|nr:aminopeptidase [Anaerolineales bacterium]